MLNYVHENQRQNYTNPSSSVTLNPGAVVVLAAASSTEPGTVGIVIDTILPLGTGVLQVKGVVSLPNTASTAWTQGQRAYWNTSTLALVTTSLTNTMPTCGRVADQAYASSATVVNIDLNVA